MISIITPSIGRNELVRCCKQIDKQKVKWQHIVMIDIPEAVFFQEPIYVKILEQIKHPDREIHFCPVRHKNFGNSCRHNAWDYAIYDYIIYVDDDDYFTDDAFEIIEDTLNKNNYPDICTCASMKGGGLFFNKPLGSCMTVTGQYLHKKNIDGKPARWIDAPTNSLSYALDGAVIETLKKMAKTFGYADNNRPIVIIEESSRGKSNKDVVMNKLNAGGFQEIIKKTMDGKNDSDGHLMTLFSLVISLNAKKILELGVRSGDSTEPLLMGAMATNGMLFSVDKERNMVVENEYSNSPHWKYTISDSLKYLRELPHGYCFDLVFVDDWHDGLHVWEEFELLDQHTTTRSLILVHDTMCWHTCPDYHLYPPDWKGEFANGGPYRALLELNPDKWEWSTIPVSHGLTLLRKKQDIEYSLILTTHKHPKEAGDVLKEIEATTQGFSKEILVIGHEETDRPIGDNLPAYKFIVQPKKGCANSIWYGAKHCVGKWFVWLCDDHKYVTRDWLAQAHKIRMENPKVKVIRFNAKSPHTMCSQIGTAERFWYLNHYPEPVFEHYGWDNEIQDWSNAEGVFYNADSIIIEDTIDNGRINMEIKGRDWDRWQNRMKEYKLVNGKMTKV